MLFGGIVTLECLGDKPGPRWLDANPANGTVSLIKTESKVTSRWRVHHDVLHEVSVILLESVNAAQGNHWLDGLTAQHAVQLAPVTDKPYTGTRWRVHADPQQQPDVFVFECLGNVPGYRWLDGLTQSGGVQLAPSTTIPPYTGTRWKIHG
ncbi:MAG TPA: hypothetical protein VM733_22210 [Thermoanaerobaculia bacterium]|nr:hypothetical protein [Thermoanaerobaculia bacterium]